MNAKRFKTMLHSRRVSIFVFRQEIDENGQTHIFGGLINPKE